MQKFCDLHIHSNFSDGTFSPAQLINAAEEAGLSAVALCDHNTVLGLPDFLAAAQDSPVEAVPGVEFSADYQGWELHILGLFIRPEWYAAITERMDRMQRLKEQSNMDLVAALNRAGFLLEYEKIKAATPSGLINRAHIAAELTRLGYTASVKEAFSTLLAPRHGYYRPPERIDAFEMIAFIKSIGAAAVWAHPFLSLKDEESVRGFLPRAKESGLDGMEVLYPLFDKEQTRLAAALASEFGLLPSGGSDFHGANKPDIRLGSGKGNLAIPLSFLDGLKGVV